MKTALVHDWLIHMRGGEKVLEAMAELYPDAVIHTLFYRRSGLSPALARMKIKPSFLHYLPGIRHYYRWLLPFLPWVVSTLKIDSDTDLVISSSHCVAKGADVPPKALHVCYCHTPMRYIWGFEKEYLRHFPKVASALLGSIKNRLREWDNENCSRVHHFIANSENVRRRIREFYGRDAEVIYPPLDLSRFRPAGERKDYYLVVSAFVPYKRVDIVIQAFNGFDRKLLIVGSGPMSADYRRLRKSENITFLGPVPDPQLHQLYAEARALIFPTEEDFGIVPLEAQACGTPVLAYGKGGALESVRSGLFFDEQTPDAVRRTVLEFETAKISRAAIPAQVASFDKSCFQSKLKELIGRLLAAKEHAIR